MGRLFFRGYFQSAGGPLAAAIAAGSVHSEAEHPRISKTSTTPHSRLMLGAMGAHHAAAAVGAFPNVWSQAARARGNFP